MCPTLPAAQFVPLWEQQGAAQLLTHRLGCLLLSKGKTTQNFTCSMCPAQLLMPTTDTSPAVFISYSALWLFLPEDIPVQDTSLCISPASCEVVFPQFPSLTDSGHYRAAASVEKPHSHGRARIWVEGLEFDKTAEGGDTHTVLGLRQPCLSSGTAHPEQPGHTHLLGTHLERALSACKARRKKKKNQLMFFPQFLSIGWVNSKCIWTWAHLYQAK